MDILFVTRPIVPPWNEGSKNLTWQLATRLTRHTPHLLTISGVKMVMATQIHWHDVYSKRKLTLRQKLRLVGYLAFKPPPVDLFHFYFVPTRFTSRILSAVTRFHGKKSVQTIPSLPANLPSLDKIRELIFADRVIVYSNHTEQKLRSWGLNNVVQIDVGIDIDRFAQAQPDPNIRLRLGLDETDVLILFAGEYARLGSVAVLKKIMPLLISRNPHCYFLIACRILSPADLAVEADLKQFVQNEQLVHRIHFLGEVSDFAALLKASDIFLFPVTDMQGKIDAPLTILEAMAASLPVVAQSVPPLDEIFGRDSLALVADGKVDLLIERLSELATDSKLRQREGRHNLETTRQRYDLDKMVMAYEAFYDSLN
jgi:glycosyltransferase involved in cell wall biosynthesis